MNTIIDEKIEQAKRFSRIWWKSRADAGVSQEYVAIGMGVSRKTIQNWEKGVSAPTLLQASEWFNVLGLNSFPYFMDFLFPQTTAGVKPGADEKRITETLLTVIEQLPLESKHKLLYILLGEHGSSSTAVLDLVTAHLQSPMKDRIVQAALIVENYEMEKELGSIVCPKNAQPDLHRLHLSIDKAKLAVRNRKTGYSILDNDSSQEEPAQ